MGTATIEKLYYSIGEVAEMFSVNSSLIRFWEREIPALHPRKNARGNRVFSKDDIEVFRKIHHLIKNEGYTLEGAKNALSRSNKNKDYEWLLLQLKSIRKELLGIRETLKG
jgi:DNA-binding transcriptional MerR regulator